MDIEDNIDMLQDDCVCSVCLAEFLDREDLEVHIKQIHLTEANKCRFCDICIRIFPDIEAYALHMRDNHLANILCCRYCIKLFNSNTELQQHEKKHNSAVLYPKISCSQCKCVFDNKNEVKDHEMNDHAISNHGIMSKEVLPILSSLLCMNAVDFFNASFYSLMYVCVDCCNSTTDIQMYLKHLVDNKCCSYVCDTCCKVYKNKQNLWYHVRQHLNGRRLIDDKKLCFKCRHTYQGQLKLHLKSCKGMCCEFCDLTFKSVNDFTNHKLKHQSKALEFVYCVYCRRQMVSGVMKKHIKRAHKNVHLYKYHCFECRKVFKHPKFLFAHFFSAHKDLHPYTCTICDQKFKVRKGFSLHIKLVHKSVGFVEFDDKFHVFFTDKKSDKQSVQNTSQVDESIDIDESSLGNDETVDKTNTNQDDVEICDIDDEIQAEDFMHNTKEDENIIHEISKDKNNPDIQETENLENDKLNKQKSEDINEIPIKNLEEEEKRGNTNFDSDVTIVKRPVRKSAARSKRNFKKTVKIEQENDVLSDDSDIPLKVLCNKMKTGQPKTRKDWKTSNLSKSKFICKKCNKNCYTHQNYYRHVALHTKNETKICIKCHEKFDSVNKLKEHIKNEHSSSILTDTLKKVLEKRKQTEVRPAPAETNPKPLLTMREKFQNTIKKVEIERHPTATIKLVDGDKISVKKYLENFTPDTTDVKIKLVQGFDTEKLKQPLIKLTKFTETPYTNSQSNLKMPVKFTDDFNEECHVSMKLVSNYVPPVMVFKSNDSLLYNDYYDEPEVNVVVEERHSIPEVAQEVMLVEAEESKNIQSFYTQNFKDLPKWTKNVKIAHLSTVPPYYKISNISLDKDKKFTLMPEDVVTSPRDITLTNGKKLVSANPFAHLLDNKRIAELKKSKPKWSYKPKLINVAEAITKAMEKLEGSSKGKMKV